MRPDLPDAELVQLVRVGTPPADEAMDELRRRHLPAVLAYARVCARHDRTAETLAARAFTLARREACRGVTPKETWRLRLLLLVQRAAVPWTLGARRAELDPAFAAWIDDVRATGERGTTGELPLEQRSAVLRGFRTLPVATQGLLWHTVVEEDPDAEVATLLGLQPGGIPHQRSKAQDALQHAHLQAYLERSDNEQCRGFGRIIEAVARPDDPRQSEDLDEHLAGCPGCTQALGELIALNEHPGRTLAEGLLVWGGAGYLAARSGQSQPEAAAAAHTVPVPEADGGAEPTPLDQPAAAAPPARGRRSPAVTGLAIAAGLAASVAAGFVVLGPLGGSGPDGDAKAPPRSTASATAPATHPATPKEPTRERSTAPGPSEPAASSASGPARTALDQGGSAGAAASQSPGLCKDPYGDFVEGVPQVGSDECADTGTGEPHAGPSYPPGIPRGNGSGNGNANGYGNLGTSNGQSNGQGNGY